MPPRIALAIRAKHETVNRNAVLELVALLRRLHPSKEADWLTAQALGTTERWVRAVRQGGGCTVSDKQADLATVARANLLDQEIARLMDLRREIDTKRGSHAAMDCGPAVAGSGGAY